MRILTEPIEGVVRGPHVDLTPKGLGRLRKGKRQRFVDDQRRPCLSSYRTRGV